MIAPFRDSAPTGEELTDYDRSHVKLYVRLLDADSEGAAWQEVASVLFGLDPAREERALGVYTSHLERARWMAETGYLLLLRDPRD
ncbi:DNA -binding domain-containing protein [Mesorhizobium sp. NPDC059054]|uniref:DNA -binding domain-containing protein n=1 Tax=Mesorhizobium sp. NPDC059054 TaxID=3346711 RepID=UPI0036BAFD02